MSTNSDKCKAQAPTAPYAPDDFQRLPAPPSYDDCLNMCGSSVTAHQYTYSNGIPYQQSFLPSSAPTQFSYGYTNPYQMHIQQNFYNAAPVSLPSCAVKPAENILYLAEGAKVRTTSSGAISIPPPPPGCAPTPGQIAAMSGQQVVIKKKKKSFF